MIAPPEVLERRRSLVLIIDDDHSVRGALVNLFESVGLEAQAFESVDEFLAWPLPDADICLVLDVRMPGRNGIEFQEEWAHTHGDIPVVMITAHGDIPMSVRAMKAGAIEFLPKPFREQDLLDAIHAGLSKCGIRRQAIAADADLLVRLASLSKRERQVMDSVASGLLTKQIANDLGLSEITVKLCRASMMRKIGAQSLIDLGRICERVKALKIQEA